MNYFWKMSPFNCYDNDCGDDIAFFFYFIHFVPYIVK